MIEPMVCVPMANGCWIVSSAWCEATFNKGYDFAASFQQADQFVLILPQ